MRAGREPQRIKREALQPPQSSGGPPAPDPPSCPLIPCCSLTLPPKLSPPSHFEDPRLVTFQHRRLISPRATASQSRHRNSPPALELLIRSGPSGFHPKLNFPAALSPSSV